MRHTAGENIITLFTLYILISGVIAGPLRWSGGEFDADLWANNWGSDCCTTNWNYRRLYDAFLKKWVLHVTPSGFLKAHPKLETLMTHGCLRYRFQLSYGLNWNFGGNFPGLFGLDRVTNSELLLFIFCLFHYFNAIGLLSMWLYFNLIILFFF